MKHSLSTFGKRLAMDSGIGELMQDLGQALASGDENLCMLGGGQPAHLPEVDRIWSDRLQSIAADSAQVAKVLGDYQPPGGDAGFREAVAELFRDEYGWPITGENVCITAGGQAAFFLLLNALAGRFDDGSFRKVLLPIVPEYIGYADQSTSSEMFRAVRPLIEKIGSHEFKYSIDFESLRIDESIAAICLSRPTNPSANVVTDEELQRLASLAAEHEIPLIVDNAYGDPFPGVIFAESKPIWDPSMILTYSLSKLGLPGTRTGIVIAPPQIVECLSSMNAITSLANNNIGQAMVRPLIESGELISISRDVIRPFYQQRSEQAQAWLVEALDDDLPFRIHRSEGAFFLWLWLEGLPITSADLYRRLKQRGVLVISGHYFFFGLEDDDDWNHRHECLRISFTTSESVLRRGIELLADEVNQLYATQRAMTLHPQAQAFVDELAEQQNPSWQELGVHKAREAFLTFDPMFGPAPPLARVEEHQMPGGVRLRLYSNQSGPLPVVMFFHGGGWVLGNLETHDALCRRLAVHSGCTIVAVDYGLSPENAFPGPIDDCYAATKYVAENAHALRLDASRMAVAGDSAGGHLAASVAIKARDESGPDIALQVLMYPVIQPNFETESYQAYANGYGLTRDSMKWFWEQFLGKMESSPEAVPSRAASHAGLPPAIVITAQFDVLRDEGDLYARQLQEAGVDVMHRQQAGMVHAFLHFADVFDTGVEVGKELAIEIGHRLRSGHPHS